MQKPQVHVDPAGFVNTCRTARFNMHLHVLCILSFDEKYEARSGGGQLPQLSYIVVCCPVLCCSHRMYFVPVCASAPMLASHVRSNSTSMQASTEQSHPFPSWMHSPNC
jgi:hypothetical protein